jgi:hypothetical protein
VFWNGAYLCATVIAYNNLQYPNKWFNVDMNNI